MTPGYFRDHADQFKLSASSYSLLMSYVKVFGCTITPAGSRFTNGEGHDQDYLVEVPGGHPALADGFDSTLLDDGWTPESGQLEYRPEGSAANDAPFGSWRKGELNLIVTRDHAFAERHRLGTAVLKQIKLDDKDARKYVMYAILYGEMWCGPGVLKAFGSRDDL